MTTTTAPDLDHVDPATPDHDVHDHPSDSRYWAIAGILAVVTAIEVYLSYADWMGDAVAPLMLIGMVVKFFLVAAFFMHLKFDSKPLRRLLISGLGLAVFCYMAMLFMFRQFDKESRQEIRFVPSGIPVAPSSGGGDVLGTGGSTGG